MKRVIITGGTGLIGRALGGKLARDGYEVIALTRRPEQARALPPGMRAVGWDARSGAGWAELADGAFAIVNLAGEAIGPLPWYLDQRRARIPSSRLNAGRAVVDAMQRAANKPQVLLQASAIGYYGPRGGEELTEASAPGSDYLARVCVEWEQSTAAVEALGVRRVVTRTGLLLDRHAEFLWWTALPFRLFVGGPLGSGQQWWSWLQMADEIGAMQFLLEQEGARGAFNLTATNPVTNREFGRALARTLHRPFYFPTPRFALKLVLGEVADLLIFSSQRVLPRRLQQLGYPFRFTELEPALRAIYAG